MCSIFDIYVQHTNLWASKEVFLQLIIIKTKERCHVKCSKTIEDPGLSPEALQHTNLEALWKVQLQVISIKTKERCHGSE